MNPLLTKFTFTDELTDVIENCKGVSVPTSKAELYEMVFGPDKADVYDVVFDVKGRGPVKEGDVTRCKNGASVNYVEDYMRRRASRTTSPRTKSGLPMFTAIPLPTCAARPWNGLRNRN